MGEVGDSDLDDIGQRIGVTYAVIPLISSERGRRFHMALLVRRERIVVHSTTFLTSRAADAEYRIAVLASCLVDDLSFDLFVVHWASRLYAKQDGFERGFFGHALRQAVDERLQVGRQNLILIGDFNDEPFDASLNDYLLATRDPILALRRSHLLYNPFWKRMAPVRGYDATDTHPPETFGTYYHAQGRTSKWRTLDQMLVSSSFVGGSEWHLSEDETDVWRTSAVTPHLSSTSSLLDHLPIIGTFVRYENG